MVGGLAAAHFGGTYYTGPTRENTHQCTTSEVLNAPHEPLPFTSMFSAALRVFDLLQTGVFSLVPRVHCFLMCCNARRRETDETRRAAVAQRVKE